MKWLLVFAVLMCISGPVWALNVNMGVNAEGTDKPVVVGTTNLPDGIELMVTTRRKASGYPTA